MRSRPKSSQQEAGKEKLGLGRQVLRTQENWLYKTEGLSVQEVLSLSVHKIAVTEAGSGHLPEGRGLESGESWRLCNRVACLVFSVMLC